VSAPIASADRRIWLCADDYGISSGVNTAIRDLVVRGRINATSVMVAAPSFHRSDAMSLAILNTGQQRAAIGLHLTLTAPFRPLSENFAPLREGCFLSLAATLRHASLRRFEPTALEREVEAQIKIFVGAFGRAPDFLDGHRHVQLFPQIREAVMTVIQRAAPAAWLRQCGRVAPLSKQWSDGKGLLLDHLSRQFRQRAQAAGIKTNPAFAGTYTYRAKANFAALFPRFLDHLPDGGLIMCHPGFVDAELQRLDPLTDLREREYDFFAGDEFMPLLARRGVALI
jgi:predicted glycoside hydrolase/deacetylase ChbG (UPF0249 family)